MEEMVRRLNPILRGWINYFRIANCKRVLVNSWDGYTDG
ncbi:Retron-type reverse transcriptase [Calderihabitans maritimus]|uniref:Retron-type reverse transcriptase n=1 Tax=Calderihabitans maritimus TaxID=1246530 RepID=A0A1Z5HSI4_9FIRM|nr:Retron-type reverse transcriptase [Calderihabitans maritimus]